MSLHWLGLLLLLQPAAFAWDHHARPTFVALKEMDFFKKNPLTQVEPLETFLQAESARLVKVLEEEEKWAQTHVKKYPPLPSALIFNSVPHEDPAHLRARFLKALRMNAQSKLALYLQKIPGRNIFNRASLKQTDVTLLPDKEVDLFIPLQPPEKVPVIDVLSSATDEPDYGLDIGLWDDNEGKPIYGFGPQPFGNPSILYSSQSPFHMGFFYENPLVYRLASFTERTYPEMRVHQCMKLGYFALSQGHPYWGWRFLGWALHYIQDMTQPYHSTLLPGTGLIKMLAIHFLDAIGIKGPKRQIIQLITNEHLALEKYQSEILVQLLKTDMNSDLIQALQSGQDINPLEPHSDFLRNEVAKEAHQLGHRTHDVLSHSLPPQLVADANYIFSVTDPNLNLLAEIKKHPELNQEGMNSLILQLMRNLGKNTRAFIQPFLPLPSGT